MLRSICFTFQILSCRHSEEDDRNQCDQIILQTDGVVSCVESLIKNIEIVFSIFNLEIFVLTDQFGSSRRVEE